MCHQDENSSTRSQTNTEFSRKIFLVGVYNVKDVFTHSHQSIAPRLFLLFIHQFQDYVFNGNLIESNSSLALPNCDPIHIDRYKLLIAELIRADQSEEAIYYAQITTKKLSYIQHFSGQRPIFFGLFYIEVTSCEDIQDFE